MASYNHEEIEKKWQKKWEEEGLYRTEDNVDKEKCYVLDMFPYPSGEGLHVGHLKGYIATDIYSRYKRMSGYNVLHPMGWDAFGLPAENFALKNKVHPREAVKKNIARYKEQLSVIGFSYDWEREINTTDSTYYRWTQWIFLKLFEKGLAYESHEPINWCPQCMTGLANEDLEGNECERCGTVVEKKPMRQWMLKITDYADRLLNDLETLDWPKSIKESQRNWIGKSEGAEISFQVLGSSFQGEVKVFTTRPDTLFGATYIVLAPEHELVEKLKDSIENWTEAESYIKETQKKTDLDRQKEEKNKTGVELKGVKAVNPANNEKIPIFIADYVLLGYGTGAIMAVPAHDERDFAFAKKFSLQINYVVLSDGSIQSGWSLEKYADEWNDHYANEGKLINSGKFDGLTSEEAKEKITKKVGGEMKSTYRLQDWVFSRQRYWGEPIPLIHCKKCGVVAVPEKDLPVTLPEVEHYEPTGTGKSPLAGIDSWVNTTCPKCGGEGKRETNTMPQWAGSSWYHLRYIDPENNSTLVDKKKEKDWSPVDMYVGGAEHATRHLIYARFWHKFLFDIDIVNYSEPFKRLQHVGLILAEDGRKMSKRYENIVNPDNIVHFYGADTLRLYEMFMGPFAQSISWSTESIIGPRKFLEKIWNYYHNDWKKNYLKDDKKDYDLDEWDSSFSSLLHQTTKKVGDDIENFKFNTVISALMILLKRIYEEERAVNVTSTKSRQITILQLETLLKLIAPFAPHLIEEIWFDLQKNVLKRKNVQSVHLEEWPKYDKSKLVLNTVSIVVQVNGKTRGIVESPSGSSEEDILALVRADEGLSKWTGGDIKRVIYIMDKLLNIVL